MKVLLSKNEELFSKRDLLSKKAPVSRKAPVSKEAPVSKKTLLSNKGLLSLKVLLSLFLVLLELFNMSPTGSQAGESVARPAIKASTLSNGNSIDITVSETAGADGYYIYAKYPGSDKYQKVYTIEMDGTKKRTCTLNDLEAGDYSFKVKAYAKKGNKIITGKFSKVKSATISSPTCIIINNKDVRFKFSKGNYPTKKKPYTIDFYASPDLKDACFALEYVDANGNIRPRDVEGNIRINSLKLTVYATGIGSADIAVVAYLSEKDAKRGNNPYVISDIMHFVVADPSDAVDENDDPQQPEEEEKLADIVFENGYVYIGSYPQNKVTDSKLISELNALNNKNPGSQAKSYKDKMYQLATVKGVDSWYESDTVEWIILEGSADSDTITLMANTSLLSTGFCDWSGYTSGAGWKDSFLRYHLNGYSGKTFKSIWSYDFLGVLFSGRTEQILMEQSYGKVKDKIILATKEQLEKMTAKQRIRPASAMATVAGECGYWLMDSAGSGKQYVVDTTGKITTTETWRQEYGVVPVVKIDLKKCNIIVK